MGRVLLVILIIVVIVVLWRAFGPSSWKKNVTQQAPRTPIAPDDDPEFLWKLEKQARERRKAEKEKRNKNSDSTDKNEDKDEDEPLD